MRGVLWGALEAVTLIVVSAAIIATLTAACVVVGLTLRWLGGGA